MAFDFINLPKDLGTISFNGNEYKVVEIKKYDLTGKQVMKLLNILLEI